MSKENVKEKNEDKGVKTKASKNSKANKGKRYTPAERAKLLAKYHKLRQGGATTGAAAEQVGVPYITLRMWAKKEANGGAPVKAKKASSAKTSAPYVLVLPSGMRVECASATDLTTVIRGLQ
jgi:hypothetical protein